MFVTGLKLANVVNKVIYTGVKGFAHFGGLCKRKTRFGQVEDVPHTFSGTSPLAHELGHLMGMPHDGDLPSYDVRGIQWLRCSAKSGYLMAPEGGGANEGFFTQCSLQHMAVFLKTLDQDCFKFKSQTVIEAPGKLPGGQMDISTLCKRRYPHVSGITGVDEPTLRKTCEYLCCPLGDSQGNVTCLVESHVDGMPCGSGQICKRKRCGKHSVNLPPPPSVPINQP
uniref:Putative metalloprotease n=1 Tax=Ixodes ricinus TaxID=34613 RepID=A0A0K8RFY8_IXORI